MEETFSISEWNTTYNISCCPDAQTSLPCSCSSNTNGSDNSTYPGSGPMPKVMGPQLYQYIYITVINAIVFIVGIVGNSLVIQVWISLSDPMRHVVARTRSMRKRMNYFLVSLSVADLLVLVVCLPIALLEFYGKDKWLIGEPMCKIVPFLENASHHCSVLTLVAIGFERYYAICHPLKETRGARVASTNVLIPAVWVISVAVSLPFALISHIKVVPYYDGTLVEVCRTNMDSELSRAYIIFIFTVCLALPLVVLTVMYTAIIMTLAASTMAGAASVGPGAASTAPRASRGSLDSKASVSFNTSGRLSLHSDSNDQVRNARAIASRRQVVRMMMAVMALYFLCLLPMRSVQLWVVFGPKEDLESLGFEGYLNLINCSRILIYVNSAGNPIIYGLLSANFRTAFRQSCFTCRHNRRNSLSYNTTYYNNNHHYHYYLHSHGTPSHVGQNNQVSQSMASFPSHRTNVSAKSKMTTQSTTASPTLEQRRLSRNGVGIGVNPRDLLLRRHKSFDADKECTIDTEVAGTPDSQKNGAPVTYV
ncbi:QRFP-like peptide receptor isoform X2 [Aplysia californica]|uniref:QRFP-like peptide receptor isoform X2 n=1 Tax=Aplysia californica TaxID=6500 RepID=A0ABM1W0U8_APLCA|nr:QRFP-like peptide receptor isoform X2 [Aplysia californica]